VVSSDFTLRSIVSWLEDEQYEFHCYQLKEDRPYRVCVKGLHHSTLSSQIKEEIEKAGHKVLDVHTPLKRSEPGTPTSKPVNIFFINIAAAANNKAKSGLGSKTEGTGSSLPRKAEIPMQT